MNEIVFKTKSGKVLSAFFAGDGDYPKANLYYSLEDIAGEVFLDETGKSSSVEVKIPEMVCAFRSKKKSALME